MFDRILIPVDLAEPSFARSALAAVKGFVAEGAHVRLVTVRHLMPQMMTDYLPSDFDTASTKESIEGLEAMAKEFGLPADKTSQVVRLGGVYHEVLDEAASFKADLIVIGSHRPSMATYLLGSNASNIVRHATCSVLVIR
jgi:nucleotide-binding universal stress UspA family protein